jgi:superfamily II DNA helicase RecQ
LKPKSKYTTTKAKAKTKTYYIESLKQKPKGPKHTIKLQTTESPSKCKQNRYYKPSTHGTKSLSQSKWKQILQAFNTWHKILEPKQMEANITSLQLIIDGTQNPTKHSLCTKSSSIVVLYFFIYLSYLTNINN